MKTIKTTIAVVSILFTSVLLDAQEQQTPPPIVTQQLPKVREFGIGLNNINLMSFNNFSLQYRWGNENRLYRISGDIGGTITTKPINNNNSSSNYTTSYSPLNVTSGLTFGIIKIKPVSEKFGLMYGSFLGGGYWVNKSISTSYHAYYNSGANIHDTITTKENRQSFSVSAGFILGAVYKISSSFLLYAEIDPGVNYTYIINSSTTTTNSSSLAINPNSDSHSNSFGINGLSNSGASLTIVYRITK